MAATPGLCAPTRRPRRSSSISTNGSTGLPGPAEPEKARAMMEACLEADLCGLRVWMEEGRLKFERQSLLLRAARPGR